MSPDNFVVTLFGLFAAMAILLAYTVAKRSIAEEQVRALQEHVAELMDLSPMDAIATEALRLQEENLQLRRAARGIYLKAQETELFTRLSLEMGATNEDDDTIVSGDQ